MTFSQFKNKWRTVVFVFLIIILSFILRFYRLGSVPNGLTVDEADMGYNAYSILKTGKDVYGRKMPIFFQSLDDYKPGFAIYASIPAIKIFGLSDYSIRFFPALLGALTPFLIFVFLKLLFPKQKPIAYVSLILVTFSPWNIAISRATFMYIELIFFVICSFIFFVLGIQKKPIYLVISAILFSFTLYIYYASVIYIPTILIILGIIYRKNLIKFKKYVLLSTITLVIVALPAVLHYTQSNSKNRFNAISIFTPDITLPLSIKEIDFDKNNNDNLITAFHNRRYIYSLNFIGNYLKFYDLDYLFVNSSGVRYFYVNYVGLFYLVELPLFLLGLFKIFAKKEKNKFFVLALMLVGAFPAAITLGAAFPHRGILLILAIQIIIAIGFADLFKIINPKYHKLALAILTLGYITSIASFTHQYFVHSPKEFLSENDNGAWFSTVKSAIPKLTELKPSYQKIVFTWSKAKLVPPIYYLFYNKIDPTIIQNKAGEWINEPPSFRQIYGQIDNIEFRPINWLYDKSLKNTLFIGYESDFPKDTQNIIDKTYLPGGQLQFLFVKSE